MSFQDQGCFQLAFDLEEFFDAATQKPKYASRDVKLSGRYKLYIKGVSFVSDFTTTTLDINTGFVLLLQSPNIIQNFVPNIPGYAFQFQNYMFTDPTFAGKLSACYGDMSFYSMAYIQDRMDFLLTAGVQNNGSAIDFSQSVKDVLGDFASGILLFNFEFERVDKLY